MKKWYRTESAWVIKYALRWVSGVGSKSEAMKLTRKRVRRLNMSSKTNDAIRNKFNRTVRQIEKVVLNGRRFSDVSKVVRSEKNVSRVLLAYLEKL